MLLAAKSYCDELYTNMAEIVAKRNDPTGLAIITVGDDPASKVYVRNKLKTAKKLGIETNHITFDSNVNIGQILLTIQELNCDPDIHGIIVQLPLPKHLTKHIKEIQKAIDPKKDVDGFHPESFFLPCTVLGIFHLLLHYNIKVEGKHCVVIGRSDIVGKPLAKELLAANATVTICHSRTSPQQRVSILKQADIIFSAAGVPNLIKPEDIKPGAILIDISINRDEQGHLCGDAALGCEEVCSAITPVPGGIGLMTVEALMTNTIHAYDINKFLKF